ncbi:MAG: hypothetical protein JOZ25_04080 [Actinobacteria bacterium]|nr:hypothetical protein [Actinomycetota bacterium]
MRSTALESNLLSVSLVPLALARGSWVMVAFCFFMFFGIVIGYYTRKGSGIEPRPYGKVYGGAPGAIGPGSVSGRDDRERVDWSRGTR